MLFGCVPGGGTAVVARTATPKEFAAMFRSELARYAQNIKAAGIRIE